PLAPRDHSPQLQKKDFEGQPTGVAYDAHSPEHLPLHPVSVGAGATISRSSRPRQGKVFQDANRDGGRATDAGQHGIGLLPVQDVSQLLWRYSIGARRDQNDHMVLADEPPIPS